MVLHLNLVKCMSVTLVYLSARDRGGGKSGTLSQKKLSNQTETQRTCLTQQQNPMHMYDQMIARGPPSSYASCSLTFILERDRTICIENRWIFTNLKQRTQAHY